MAAKFDTAISELVLVMEGVSGFSEVTKACVVRDLRGRVRLVIDAPAELPTKDLEGALGARLGGWFHGPVLNASAGSASERRLAKTLLDRATSWPLGWPRTRTDATGATIEIGARWTGYQRVLSKQAWLENTSTRGGAWPLEKGNPAIVAFYSFKGGVGRSTLLGVTAWQLARAGKTVVCLDLDLEAPGLGGLFDVNPEESLLDHLLAHAATGQMPPEDPVTWTTIHKKKIGVVPAGRLERAYVEKLARLDYLGATTAAESPVAKALQLLLERIKGQHKPDYILLDCRAGLHDLGGLSLTDVAHVDVLVGRDTPQGRNGLALTLEILSTRRRPDDQRILLVQTFVPLRLGSDVAEATKARFRAAMYDACSESVYAPLDDAEVPAQENGIAPHYPSPIGQYDEIAVSQRLEDLSLAVLQNDTFTATRQRIEALTKTEETSDEEEADGGTA